MGGIERKEEQDQFCFFIASYLNRARDVHSVSFLHSRQKLVMSSHCRY